MCLVYSVNDVTGWYPGYLSPLRGAISSNIVPGGLRGLRPPATFFATLRVSPRRVNYLDGQKKAPAAAGENFRSGFEIVTRAEGAWPYGRNAHALGSRRQRGRRRG